MGKKQKTLLGSEDITWQLSDLYSSIVDTQLLSDSKWCRHESEVIQKLANTTVAKLTATELYDFIKRLEQLDSQLQKLQCFAFLNYCTQYGNEKAGALEQKIRELSSECAAKTVFFSLEWNALSEQHINDLLGAPKLKKYRYYLQTLRNYRPHQLSEKEEKILLEKEPVGRQSWVALFEKVLANYKFGKQGRSEEEVLTDLHNPDRVIRRNAAAEMTAGLKDNSHILTHIFNVLAADKMITDRLRNYQNWLGAMNLHNNLHDETVNILVDAVTARYDIVQRYYTMKKKMLGLDQLVDYDRYAPLPSLPAKQIHWDECRESILASFTDFSPEMAKIATDFFDKKWIHAPVMHGKQGGAFAHPCVPEAHPYILVNYTGTINDVSTVAHELGHGVHQVLAAERGLYNSDTPLPLAETASVFAELLVFNSQLDLLCEPEEKRAFICQKLESIFATVFRQTAMNRFEHAMHTGRRLEGELSQQQLSQYWLTTQQEMFSDSIHLSDDYALWWSYIPHFIATPGYVYSYAFGELLVLALYGTYQQEGEGFVEKYLQLLAAGGSASPYDLLKPFDIDLNSVEFWNKGLKVIEEMLEKIIE